MRRGGAMEQRVGLLGCLPKSPSRSIQGLGSSCRAAAIASHSRHGHRHYCGRRQWRAPQSESPGATCSSNPTAERGRYARSAAATVAKFAVVRPQSEGQPRALRRPEVVVVAGTCNKNIITRTITHALALELQQEHNNTHNHTRVSSRRGRSPSSRSRSRR